MIHRSLTLAGAIAFATAVSGCGGGGGSTAPAPGAPVQSLSRSVNLDAQAESNGDAVKPILIHMGFKHTAETSPKYGPIAFYAPNAGITKVITEKAGALVAFLNDDTTRHTASGLGSSGFPASFDNTGGLTPTGNTIDGGTTWSSGSVNPNATSKSFTVGPKGVYYFGCYYHYRVSPSMRDVLISK